jgi:Tfp pilus assembly protein PilF
LGYRVVEGARAYALRGRTKQAILELHNALVLDPGGFHAHHSLGVIYANQGSVDPAGRHYRRELEIAPTHVAAHNNPRIPLAGGGHVQDTFEHFSTAA